MAWLCARRLCAEAIGTATGCAGNALPCLKRMADSGPSPRPQALAREPAECSNAAQIIKLFTVPLSATSVRLQISFTSAISARVAVRWRKMRYALETYRAAPQFSHCSRSPAQCSVAVARGHSMRSTLLHKDPRIVLVANFLSRADCEAIIRLASETTWLHSAAAGEARRYVAGRSNKWCCIGSESPVLARAIERACWLTGLTPAHAEDLQVVHYELGQQYQLHVDHYTSRDVKDAAALQRNGGNRLISVFVYLSDVAAGGATAFPMTGVRVAPVCGCALLWHNIDKRGLLDGRTLHAGEPVERGSKWGMNIWLRQRPRHDDCGGGGGGGAWERAPAPPVSASTPNGRESATLRERN